MSLPSQFHLLIFQLIPEIVSNLDLTPKEKGNVTYLTLYSSVEISCNVCYNIMTVLVCILPQSVFNSHNTQRKFPRTIPFVLYIQHGLRPL